MEKEWTDKQKYDISLKNTLDLNVIIMLIMKEHFGGKEAIKKFYDSKNKLVEIRIGKAVRLGSKVVKTLSPQKFIDIFISQILKNLQFMVPLKCITNIERLEKKIIIHIDDCLCKRLFRQSIRNFKAKDQLTYEDFCKYNCIPTMQTFANLGNVKVSADFRKKGCDIIATISEKIE
ncbi:MAG: hypothetical protein ACTSRG_14895 [Candidatus Helarchaeota archaeon]